MAKRQSGRVNSSNRPNPCIGSVEYLDTTPGSLKLAVDTSDCSWCEGARSGSFVRRAILSLALLVLPAAAATAQLVIGDSPGIFVPSFRDPLNTDALNTTFFGWGPSTGWGATGNFKFDGLTDNNLIDNPPALQGVGGLTGTLNQVGTNTVLSSSNNIYSGESEETHLKLEVPINGTTGTGFTTIIVQGHTLFGGFAAGLEPTFGEIGGVAPEVVFGMNTAGQGQFWVKYELPGNSSLYAVDIALQSHSTTSIGELTVDTKWSATGYASETAQAVPEPGSAMLILGGMLPLALRRKRRNASALA